MPRGFALPTDYTVNAAEPSEVWIPLQIDPKEISHGNHGLYGAAALVRGATAESATDELRTLTANLTRQGTYPGRVHFEPFAVPVDKEIRGGARPALVLVIGAVLFLLLIACANVANLLLARADARQREISVRAAIGAGQARLVRQLMTESLLLAIAGAVLGLVLACAGVRIIASNSARLPPLAPVGLEPRMMLFAAALSILTTFVFGLVPALQMLRLNLTESLRESAATTSAGVRRRACAASSPRPRSRWPSCCWSARA